MLDGTGRPLKQYDADHSGEGPRHASQQAQTTKRVRVCFGRSRHPGRLGLLVETFVKSGFTLSSINPKQVNRLRDRFTVAGTKDDARDALVLASSLETDRQSNKRVEIDFPELICLRELSRFQDELKVEMTG